MALPLHVSQWLICLSHWSKKQGPCFVIFVSLVPRTASDTKLCIMPDYHDYFWFSSLSPWFPLEIRTFSQLIFLGNQRTRKLWEQTFISQPHWEARSNNEHYVPWGRNSIISWNRMSCLCFCHLWPLIFVFYSEWIRWFYINSGENLDEKILMPSSKSGPERSISWYRSVRADGPGFLAV